MIDRILHRIPTILRHRALWLGLGAASLSGLASGFLLAYVPDPAIVDALRRYEPSVVTRIYDDAGMQFTEWSQERREVVSYDQIAPVMVQAVVAAEDAHFFDHVGIDVWAVLRSTLANLRCGGFCQGFSTITMQIPRNLDVRMGGDTWLPTDKTLKRKLLEGIYAIQIERHYSKEQIFAIYANQIFMGHNVYGFQAAAEYYFGRPVRDVTLPEAALLAGMIQRPNDFNPYRYPEAALAKRDVVLNRMLDEGFITEEEAAEASASPLILAEDRGSEELAPYFTEEIRKRLIEEYTATGIYRSGLEVYTTMDRELQRAARVALDRGLRAVDKRRGWRGDARNLLDEDLDPNAWEHHRWQGPVAAGDILPAVVLQVSPETARVRIGDRVEEIDPADAEWTRRDDMSELVKPGDVVQVLVDEIDEEGSWQLRLEQEPVVQGAVLVVENHTGEVKALVGGRGFDDSEFNRAIQAVRQTGSVFKPFVYTTAISEGVTPSELFLDEPHTFRDPSTRQPYAPANFGDEYIGITSIAEAMSKSRNVPTVKLQQQVGLRDVIDTTRRFGLTAPLQPVLSLALGVIDVSLWEIVRAYAVFPNQGVLVEPHLFREVRDRDGRLLQKSERRAEAVIQSDVAYVMNEMFQAGIERGTGVQAKSLARELGMPLGGKSGTTDDYSDAWYVGFSPNHTVGVWVGHDTKRTIGRLETGSRAALPIWINVMAAAERGNPPKDFAVPGNVVLRTVDPFTGLLHGPYCSEALEMAYIEGTQPTRVCGRTEHDILSLPSYQQGYFLSNGRLDTGG